MKTNIQTRFESKIEKIPDGCWVWMASCRRTGYGQFRFKNKMIAAHRMSWILRYGELLPDQCVLHKCDNPCCVNPNHLFLGTPKDNTQDMISKNRQNPGKPKGEINGKHKISQKDVLKIRNDNRLQREIAKDFSITQAQVSKIKLKNSWSHVR